MRRILLNSKCIIAFNSTKHVREGFAPPFSFFLVYRIKHRLKMLTRCPRWIAFFISWLWLVVGFQAVAATGTDGSATITTDHTTLLIASENHTIVTDKPFWVMLRFELEKDWHIYWKNPGDSGLAPTVSWTLPQGFSAAPIHWQAPNPIAIGGLVDYGYEGTVRLLVPITPPKDLPAGQTIEIALKANWLSCHDICLPEKGEAHFTVKTAQAGESEQPSRFTSEITEAAKTLPLVTKTAGTWQWKPSSASQKPQAIQLSFALPEEFKNRHTRAGGYPDNKKIDSRLRGNDDNSIQAGYFYPDEAGWLKHTEAQSWQWHDKTLFATLTADAETLPSRISGLMTLSLNDGTHKSYALTFEQGVVAIPATALPSPALSSPAPATEETLSAWQAMLFALLGGLLLNAMPCVFPVLSLKALAISKKASAEQAAIRKQGLGYLAGTVTSFLTLALILVLLKQSGNEVGWGFQLQNPPFVAAMAYLFLLIGLTLAGFYELPSFLGGIGAEKAAKDSIAGSFFTGVLAVLVATPCTVPFMAPALGYAFTQSAPLTFSVMAAMGTGLALPYLAISFYPPLQRILPKPGNWMVKFKEFMAFPIFATAAWLVWVLTQQIDLLSLAGVLAVFVLLPFFIWLAKGRKPATIRLIEVLALLMLGYNLLSLQASNHSMVLATMQQTAQETVAYSPERLEQLRAEGKPVFLDATAAWCLTCKVNERLALRSAAVQQAFADKKITVMVADWTNYDPAITALLGDFSQQGVPLYVYFPPNSGKPIKLPQLLTETIVLDAVK
jgi:thiol:disulfide interchange protein DsbD